MLNFELLEGNDSPLTSNSYLLKGKPLIQIDAGAKNKADILILTHCHFDHIVYAAEMKRMGVKVYASKETADAVKDMKEETYSSFYGKIEPFEVDVVVKENDGINNENFSLEVIETPGHCLGSICLWDKNKHILFSGDTIFDVGSYGRTDLKGGNESELEKSVKKLWGLKPKIICAGHGEVVYLKV